MRTHFCGLIDESLIGQTVTLCGWADVARNMGGLVFIDLRDHEGIVQVVAEPSDAAHGRASAAEGRTPEAAENANKLARQRGTRRTLVRVLEVILRLAHPFMPFITEEIWQRIKGQAGISGETIMLQAWPVANESRIDAAAEGDIEWVKQLMLGVRQIRGEMKISMAKRIDIIVQNANAEDLRRLADFEPLLNKLAKLESVRVLAAGEEAPMSATALVGEMQVLVPMAGLIDKDAELARLDKEIQRLQGEVQRVGGKLSNEGFVAKAPAEVLDKERAKLAEAEAALAKLVEQREKIANL